ALLQFGLFGMDGWNAPIQQIGGLQWSHLTIAAGPAVLLMFGTSILILLLVGALTMCLSELSQNGIVPLAVESALLLYTLLFDYALFSRNRLLSQIWQYFPLQRVNDTLLYDERLVPIAGRLTTAIPFSTAVYALLTALLLALCIGHALLLRRDRR
ncbi:MAG: hypothetical protein IJ751_06510, partial [Oscillospiraceae bacterium]|nr:hypothetical protein [Oscillospiraceae bacterium]